MQIKDVKSGLIVFAVMTAAVILGFKINEKLNAAKQAPLANK